MGEPTQNLDMHYLPQLPDTQHSGAPLFSCESSEVEYVFLDVAQSTK